MDIAEVIQKRRSMRAFKPDPVPEKTLRQLMELAQRAPSWGNTQPWRFAIVSGKKLTEIKQGFVAKAGQAPVTDIPLPPGFPEPYDSRRRAFGQKVFETVGIRREDKEKREQWRLRGLQLFGAPCAIYILIDRAFYMQGGKQNVWPLFDCGMIAENIVLLATNYGLGTIPEIQAVHYPDVLRTALGLPDSVLVVLGIAIGYPDEAAPENTLRSGREPLDSVATWYGFP